MLINKLKRKSKKKNTLFKYFLNKFNMNLATG